MDCELVRSGSLHTSMSFTVVGSTSNVAPLHLRFFIAKIDPTIMRLNLPYWTVRELLSTISLHLWHRIPTLSSASYTYRFVKEGFITSVMEAPHRGCNPKEGFSGSIIKTQHHGCNFKPGSEGDFMLLDNGHLTARFPSGSWFQGCRPAPISASE